MLLHLKYNIFHNTDGMIYCKQDILTVSAWYIKIRTIVLWYCITVDLVLMAVKALAPETWTNDRKWQGAALHRVETCTDADQSVVRIDRQLVFSFLVLTSRMAADELHERGFFFSQKRCRWSEPNCQGQTVKRKYEKEEEKKIKRKKKSKEIKTNRLSRLSYSRAQTEIKKTKKTFLIKTARLSSCRLLMSGNTSQSVQRWQSFRWENQIKFWLLFCRIFFQSVHLSLDGGTFRRPFLKPCFQHQGDSKMSFCFWT